MRFSAMLTLCVAACVSAQAADAPVAPPTNTPAGTSNLVEKGSYAFGATLGNNLRMQGAEPNLEQVLQGFRDGLAGKTKLSEAELRENYVAWQREVRNAKMEKNKKVGEEFLARKASEPGVKKMPSGLLYKVIATGKGAQPKPTDRVSAHYKGTLIDGTEFDSSYTRGQPFTTQVTRVVPGWQEALTNMHVGDKWELYLPPNLAYGERGMGAKIQPNSTLIFEMELLDVLPPETNAPAGPGAFNISPSGSTPVRVGGGNNGQPQIRVTPSQPQTPPPAK